jgi:CelD/BcsL family acetyltransferase involved in cellulose biosynthesis
MRVDLIHPKELDAAAIGAWQALRAAHPAYASPYFHPRFTQVVGSLREDARVFLVEDGGRPVAFWGLHVRPDGYARPLGQPLADENGPIFDQSATLDFPALLREARIGAASFTGMPLPATVLSPFITETGQSARIDLRTGGAATLASLTQEHSTHFKNMRRKERKALELHGEIGFDGFCRDPAVLQLLIDWKRAQFVRTGIFDVLSPAWARALIIALAQETAPDFRGLVTVIRLGGHLGAVEFSLQGDGHLHSWITAYNPAHAALSPGHLMQIRVIENAEALGIKVIDIGVGEAHYKRFYANAWVALTQGVVPAASLTGAVHGMRSSLWRAAEATPIAGVAGLFGRLRRRTEIIVSAEQSFAGRCKGLAQAFSDASTRVVDG